ncbi:MAG TPA: protoporphyrinogen oxidase HemJ [Alphaproteobacteria bacterium]|nr:protoporphyrinogen oxidase HemJ [Alphaproteobacteria bacterium]HNS44707.1 protoporphyrinogen oxidase HemJ [Alphaproteobacteria bacterium]
MQDFLLEHYATLKALHIIAVISFMAGMLYLPRLFIYHVEAPKGSQMSETFKVMERRLLKIIINPAFVAALLFGGLMFWANPSLFSNGWMHAKLFSILLLGGVHGAFSKWRKQFERDENIRPAKFYRIWNEVPTVLMIAIVILAVVKPF